MRFSTFAVACSLFISLSGTIALAGGLENAGILEMDRDRVSVPSTTAALMSGCDVRKILSLELKGDAEAATNEMKNAEIRLGETADKLDTLVSKQQFEKPPLKLPSDLHLFTKYVVVQELNNGDAILHGISVLARQSAEELANMQKGGNDDAASLTRLIQNDADMSQLILAFYKLFAPHKRG